MNRWGKGLVVAASAVLTWAVLSGGGLAGSLIGSAVAAPSRGGLARDAADPTAFVLTYANVVGVPASIDAGSSPQLALDDANGKTVTTCTVTQGSCAFTIPSDQVSDLRGTKVTIQSASPVWSIANVVNAQTIPQTGDAATVASTNPVLLELANPSVSGATCGIGGLNVAVVVDLSGSMSDNNSLGPLQTTARAYVTALQRADSAVGTKSNVSLYTFGTDSPAAGSANQNRTALTSVDTDAGSNQLLSWINGWVIPGSGGTNTARESTNWQSALQAVAQSDNTYNLVVFITDGDPNYSSHFTSQIQTGDSNYSAEMAQMNSDNTVAANVLKAAGTRIIVITTVSQDPTPAQVTSIKDISGPVTGDKNWVNNDYFVSSFSGDGISALLESIGGLCALPSLSVQKSGVESVQADGTMVISYSFLVTNTGTTPLTAIGIDEGTFTGSGTKPVVSCATMPDSLLPAGPDRDHPVAGSQGTCTATYVVTQADIAAGSVSNQATAHGTPPDTTVPVESLPDQVTVTLQQPKPSDTPSATKTVTPSATPSAATTSPAANATTTPSPSATPTPSPSATPATAVQVDTGGQANQPSQPMGLLGALLIVVGAATGYLARQRRQHSI